ncbi:MAG: phosphatidate cytidylyltransferase [Chitinophagaceae bacterium]|nr:phosphatidate cytidylyltransferase [Chitinophagaceae bacterium]
MKKLQLFTLLSVLAVMFSGCELIGGIFKAGVWSGIIIVVLVIVLIIWLIGRMGRKG